jgi:hypothetical protein
MSISRYPIAFRPGLRPGADDAAVAAALLSGQAEADADTECASVFACAVVRREAPGHCPLDLRHGLARQADAEDASGLPRCWNEDPK